MDAIDKLQLCAEKQHFVRTADECDNCDRKLGNGQAWYSTRTNENDERYCEKCAKTKDNEDLYCFYDGSGPEDIWVEFFRKRSGYEVLLLNACPERDMSGVNLPHESVLAKWYTVISMLFDDTEIDVIFKPDGPTYGNIRGWVPLAMKGNFELERGHLEKYRLTTDGLWSLFEYPIPTFLALNCNREASKKRQLALFGLDTVQIGLYAIMLSSNNKTIEENIQALGPMKLKKTALELD